MKVSEPINGVRGRFADPEFAKTALCVVTAVVVVVLFAAALATDLYFK